MLTGKNIYARPALKMGLVDELVEPTKLHRAACTMAKKLAAGKFQRTKKKSILNKLLEDTRLGQIIVLKKAREMAMKMSQGNYPAIPAILDCVEKGLKKGKKAGLKMEAKKFEELMLTDESKALIGIFHNMTDKKKNPRPDLIRPVKTLAMLGAGFYGGGYYRGQREQRVSRPFKGHQRRLHFQSQATDLERFKEKAQTPNDLPI